MWASASSYALKEIEKIDDSNDDVEDCETYDEASGDSSSEDSQV